jgi:hypothetical protein
LGENNSLNNLEEIIGEITNVKLDKNRDMLTLVFSFQKEIEIPYNIADVNFIMSLIGERVGMIFIDGYYRIRN